MKNKRIGKTFAKLVNDLKPGDVFKSSNGKKYLVGHINSSGGTCDDCLFWDEKAVLIKTIKNENNWNEDAYQ
jgi:hypothetical protein